MQKSFVAILALALASASVHAEPAAKFEKAAPPAKLIPLKRATSGNSCAAYGAGFVKIEGTETCVKVGGAVSVGAGTSVGGR